MDIFVFLYGVSFRDRHNDTLYHYGRSPDPPRCHQFGVLDDVWITLAKTTVNIVQEMNASLTFCTRDRWTGGNYQTARFMRVTQGHGVSSVASKLCNGLFHQEI